uniref:Uncharacterized protein n=1 Tax=Glossina pallidipes TaxID=7398 RepID=A0A1A9ZV87_GLOPL
MVFEVILVVRPVLKLFLTVAFDLAIVSKFQISILKLNLTMMTDVVLLLQMMPTIPIDVVLTVNMILMIPIPRMVLTVVIDVLLILNDFATEVVVVILALTVLIGGAMLIPNLMLTVMTEMFLFLKTMPTRLIDVVVTVNVILMRLIEVLKFPGMALIAVLDVSWTVRSFATEKIGVILVLTVLIDGLSLLLPLMTNVVLILQITPTRLIDVVLTKNVVLMMLIEMVTFPGMAPTAVLDDLRILKAFAAEKIGMILVLTVLIDGVMVATLLPTTMVDAVVVVGMVVYLMLILNLILMVMIEMLLLLKMTPTRLIDVGLTVNVVLMVLTEVLTFLGMALTAVLDVLWTLGDCDDDDRSGTVSWDGWGSGVGRADDTGGSCEGRS